MRRRQGSRIAASVAMLALVGAFFGVACGTDPIGVDACKKIERVRCESAGACGIDLTKPVHRGDSKEADVGACVRYYEDLCLHGISNRDHGEPSAQETDGCIDAIINGDCEVVRNPQSHPACAWLEPPAAPPPPPPEDAASDAADASQDG